MELSHRFIDRPIFASVISLFILIIGFVCIWLLPISEYPEVVPPSVVVSASYPGANPKVISETVAAPLEEAINGVEDMLYMSSQSTTDGMMSITVTFKLGSDADKAQQLVQNRVSQALPRLPDIVRTIGVTTLKSSPDLTMVVHLSSPNDRYDMLYLRNYALLNVKDKLARLPGVGQAMVFGGGDYAMRLWLDPKKIAARNMTASDVVNAVREQNTQVAAGIIGASPMGPDVEFELPVNVQGRLQTPEEFGEIIIKSDPNGAVLRLKDVARIELGAAGYSLRSLLNNRQAIGIGIFQAPGSNAIDISNQVHATMDELQKTFPEDVQYSIVYDPTVFVRQSIEAVISTLLEAVILVVIVVIVFLQTWRASIIPLLAVPVSVIGTFAFMYLFGFSINALSLFGLVLSIGIVVDDAIVVVENVERNIERGLTPREATYQAMREVSGPIVAIALVLCAVFIPIAFLSGLTGQFYRQFALTITISTVISAFNSLTLSPALAAVLLKPHGAKKDRFTVFLERVFGGFFSASRFWLIAVGVLIGGLIIELIMLKLIGSGAVAYMFSLGVKWLWRVLALIALVKSVMFMVKHNAGEPEGFDRFNNFFKRASHRYSVMVEDSFRHKPRMLSIYVVLIGAALFFFHIVPQGYIPSQDKEYLIAFTQLPGGASLERTDKVIREMSDIALKHPGVENSVAFPGLSIAGFSNSPNAGIVFVTLKPFSERTSPDMSGGAIAGALGQQFAPIKDGFIGIFPPPPVMGLGTTGGFKLELQDQGDVGYDELYNIVQQIQGKAWQTPSLMQVYSSYQINVPQLQVDVNRTKAKQQMVPLHEIFDAMQIYLGSFYINDFNIFGRTFRVIAQADAAFRAHAGDISQLKVRNMKGEMVPLGSLVTVKETYGPDRAMRYNAYRSADINGSPAPGVSTNQAQADIEKILKETIPKGMTYEWTDLTYQQILAGNTSMIIFPLCVLFVFLVLAALYESLSLPMAVILIVPMCLFCAIAGVWFTGKENNIFTQIGFIVLVGLACKNAILIVEFARELERQGKSIVEAAIEASHLRLRPILMTSFAFIMGVIPLVTASGAGAEMRQDMGVAVFSGMLGVTFFGLILTPIFYVAIRTFVSKQMHGEYYDESGHYE